MDAQIRRALTLIAIGLLVAGLSTCRPAYGEPRRLPEGTIVIVPGQSGSRLSGPRYLVTRSELERAIARDEVATRLETALVECSRSVVRATRPEPGWRIAGRWTAIGLAVGGAFVAGLWVGS